MADTDTPGSERRRFPRVIAHIPVRSRPLEASEMGAMLGNIGSSDPKLPAVGLKMSRAGSWSMAATNLSVGGISATGDLQVLGDQALSKGMDLLVEMDLSDGEEPLRAVAQVMWSSATGPGKYLAGLMFVVISEQDLERIRKQVSQAVERGEVA